MAAARKSQRLPTLSTASSGLSVLAEDVGALLELPDGLLVGGAGKSAVGSLAVVSTGVSGLELARQSSAPGVEEDTPVKIRAMAATPDSRYFVAAHAESHQVVLYTAADLLSHRHIHTCALSVRALSVSSSNIIAIASENMQIHMVDISILAGEHGDPDYAGSLPMRWFDTHRVAKSLAFDPRGEFLAVMFKTGVLAVYEDFALPGAGDPPLSSTPTLRCERSLREGDDGDQAATVFPLLWHPSGEALVVGGDKGAHILARGSFATLYALEVPRHAAAGGAPWAGTCAAAWSPNGRYLAIASGRRMLTIYDACVAACSVMPDGGLTPTLNADGSIAGLTIAAGGYLPLLRLDDVAEGGAYGTQMPPSSPAADDGGSGAGAATESAASLSDASDRFLGLAWGRDGRCVYHLGTSGALGYAEVRGVVEQGDVGNSVTAPLAAGDLQWPIAPPSADDGAAADDGDYGGAAEAEAGAADAAPRLAKASSYIDDAADESDAADEAAAAALPARSGKDSRPAAESGADAGARDFSIAAARRAAGYADASDGEGEEGGGLRRADGDDDDGGRGGGAAAAQVAQMLEDGKLVTSDMLEAHTKMAGRYVKEVYGLVAQQAPFQPGATHARGRKRYLAWNGVGAVVSRAEVAAARIVSIEFEDASRFRTLSITDNYGYSMAALSEHGVLLASPYVPPASADGRGDAAVDGAPSMIYYRAFDGFGPRLDWSAPLAVSRPRLALAGFPAGAGEVPASREEEEEEEESAGGKRRGASPPSTAALPGFDTSEAAESAVAVAVGDGWAAVATDGQRIRFFRSGGVQDLVLAAPGPIVTLVGRGALCAVIYHRCAPSGSRQHMAADIYLFRCGVEGALSGGGGAAPQCVQRGLDLALPPRRLLTWAGIAPNGLLLTHDDDGALLAAGAATAWSWVPVADTRHAAAHPELFAASEGGDAAAGGARSAQSRETRDAFWPIDVVLAPPSVVRSFGGADEGKNAIAPPGGLLPLLVAVLCKGGAREPSVTSPRPLASWLPLKVGILDGGSAGGASATALLEESTLRHALLHGQRGWLLALGLAPTSCDSLALRAAACAAATAARGEAGAGAGDLLADALAAALGEDASYGLAIDRAVLLHIGELLAGDREFRASQLAGRLRDDRSFAIAQKVAGKRGAGGAAERFAQLLGARQALASGELLPRDESAVGAPATSALAAAPSVIAAAAAAAERGAAAPGGGARSGFGLSRGGISGAAAASAAAAPPPPPAAFPRRAAAPPQSSPRDEAAPASSAAALAALHGAVAGGSPGPAAAAAQGRPAPARAPGAALAGNPFAAKGNPFAAKGAAHASSPQRKRSREVGGLEVFAAASPARPPPLSAPGGGSGAGPALNRQSSFAQEARAAKRARPPSEEGAF